MIFQLTLSISAMLYLALFTMLEGIEIKFSSGFSCNTFKISANVVAFIGLQIA